MKRTHEEMPSEWAGALSEDTISKACQTAKGNLRKLLTIAELSLNIDPRSLGCDMLIVVVRIISTIRIYDYRLVGNMIDAVYRLKGQFFPLFIDTLMCFEDVSVDDEKCAEYLLTIGARKFYKNDKGNKVSFVDVPFMNLTMAGIAVRRGRPRALRIFLRHGADPQTALDGLSETRSALLPRRKQTLELLAEALPRSTPQLSVLLPHLPRINTLKHLCKVVIRQSLAEASNLPLESPEEEERAAVAIQSAFRGYQTRKGIHSKKMASDEPTKEQLEAEFSADDKELCHAATKIQASFRGHQSRKTVPDTASSSNAKVDELSKDMQKMAQEEELDIDLSDPELHKAATKIQASFRGHKKQK